MMREHVWARPASRPRIAPVRAPSLTTSQPQPAQPVPGAARSEVQQTQGFTTGVARPRPAQHVPGAARSDVQQTQGFTTGVARPRPAQHVPGAARSEVQQTQGFTTGVARPRPAQHVPGAARSEVQQTQGFTTGVARPRPARTRSWGGEVPKRLNFRGRLFDHYSHVYGQIRHEFRRGRNSGKGCLDNRGRVFTSRFSDNIHINITVDALPGTHVFGESFPNWALSMSYADLLAAVSANATTQNDQIAIGPGGP